MSRHVLGAAVLVVAAGCGGSDWMLAESGYSLDVAAYGEEFAIRVHAPSLGEHTDEVLKEFGFSASEIATLRQAKAV